jgi:hypothetical protein
MSYRMLRGFLAVGLLACFALSGADSIAFQDEPGANAKRDHKSDVEQLELELKSTSEALKQLKLELNFVERGRTSGGGGTNTPLKVRGGSMTVRGIMTPPAISPTTSPWTTSIDSYHIELIDVVPDQTAFPDVRRSVVLDLPKDTAGWIIDLYGHLADNSDQSKNGIRICSDAACDLGSSTAVIVEPEPYVTGTCNPTKTCSVFYSEAINDDSTTPAVTSVRFHDTSSACTASPSATGDADVCERIREIVITLKGGSTFSYRCPNGDCLIGIGTPP